MVENYLHLALTLFTLLLCLTIKLRLTVKFDIFEPYYIIWVTYFLVMWFAPMVWLLNGQTTKFGFEIMDGLPYASLLFDIGFLSFSAAYFYCYEKRIASKQREHFPEIVDGPFTYGAFAQAAFFVISVLFVFSLATTGQSILTILSFGSIENSNDAVVDDLGTAREMLVGSSISYVPVLMLAMIYQRRARWVIVVEYVFVLTVFIARGYRYILLVLVAAPIICHYIRKNKRPRFFQVAGALVVIFAVVAVIGVTRSSYRSGATIEAFSFSDLWDNTMVNLEVFYPYYREVLYVPTEYPYAWGTSFAFIVLNFVPRSLWPNKPFPPYAPLAEFLFGVSSQTGMAYVNVGEFYLNFGPIGVFVGMGLFGYLAARSYLLIYKRNSCLPVIGYSMLAVYYIQYMTRGDFSSVSLQMFFLFAPLFVAHLCKPMLSKHSLGLRSMVTGSASGSSAVSSRNQL